MRSPIRTSGRTASDLHFPWTPRVAVQRPFGILLQHGLGPIVPFDAQLAPVGNVAQQTCCRRAEALFDIAARSLARLHALEKIRPMQRMRIGHSLHFARREVRPSFGSDLVERSI